LPSITSVWNDFLRTNADAGLQFGSALDQVGNNQMPLELAAILESAGFSAPMTLAIDPIPGIRCSNGFRATDAMAIVASPPDAFGVQS